MVIQKKHKKRYVKFALSIGLLTQAVLVLGATSHPCHFDTYLARAQTLQASFKTQVWNAQGELIDTNQGRMMIARPHRFRWEPNQAGHPIIIANHQYVWIYDKDMQQALRKPANAIQSGNPAALLSGSATSWHQYFTLERCQQSQGDRQQFFFHPKKAAHALVKSLSLVFKGNTLTTLYLSDTLGHKSQFDFYDVHYPAHLPQSLFYFTPQSGVDVVKEG